MGKVVCGCTKAAISLKRVEVEVKLLWRAYRNSPMLFRKVPFPTAYDLLFPKIGVFNRHQKFQSLLSQEWVKVYGLQIWPVDSIRPSEQNPVKNFGEKGAWAYPPTVQIFGYPVLSQERVKLRASNFVRTFTGSIGTKAH